MNRKGRFQGQPDLPGKTGFFFFFQALGWTVDLDIMSCIRSDASYLGRIQVFPN